MNMKTGGIMVGIVAILMAGLAAAAPAVAGLPDLTLEKDGQGMQKFLDLRNYTSDKDYSPGSLFYSIVKQGNSRLVDCFMEDDYFVTCLAPAPGTTGVNTITVKAINPQGMGGTGNFRVAVTEAAKPKEVTFTADRQSAEIRSGHTINFQLTAENNTEKRICFNTGVGIQTADRHEIDAEIMPESFCLAQGEGTTFTMTVTSPIGGRTGNYDIEARLEYGDSKKTLDTQIRVIDDDGKIDIARTSSYYVCSTPYEQEITVRLENNSGSTQDISLSAEHELLLPVFEFSETRLRPGESSEFAMKISTNESTALTEYTMPVSIRSRGYYAAEEISIRLVECGKDTFTLSVKPENVSLKKGETRKAKVTLRSNVNYAQEVYLSSDGELPNSIDRYKITLGAHSSEVANLSVTADETGNKESYSIKVHAWNAEENETATLKAEIRPEHSISASVQNNNFAARVCSASNAQTFAITLSNSGDYRETARLSVNNPHSEIQAVLSDAQAVIEKGGSKTVYVIVAPSFSAEPGDYIITFTAKAGSEEESEQLRFRVVGTGIEVQTNGIQAPSYPAEVTLAEGEEKEIEFAIRNPTGGVMRNVSVRMVGAAGGATMSQVNLAELKAGETRNIKSTIKALDTAANREFAATFEIKADGYLTKKNIRIIVTEKTSGGQGEATGLLTLLGNSGIQIGAGVLILLALAFLVIAKQMGKSESETEKFKQYTGGA